MYDDNVFIFRDILPRSFVYITLIMMEQIPKLFRVTTLSHATSQLMSLWLDNIIAWFCYAEGDF